MAADTDDRLIELSSLSFGYEPGRFVLESVDFTLGRGQRAVLRGPNGGGKTTLFLLVMGFLRPWSGQVRVFGRTRSADRDFIEVRRRVGLLFQDSDDQLFSPTVAEDVAFGPFNLGKSREEVRGIVERTLALVGLEGYEGRITYRLSGGEKRLVALATVLAMEPEVLLLDEPVIGLDEAHRERFIGILNGLASTFLVISHDLDFVSRLSAASWVLRDGALTPGGAS
jgi:cobalt/nickel transport system ATP-binding protein